MGLAILSGLQFLKILKTSSIGRVKLCCDLYNVPSNLEKFSLYLYTHSYKIVIFLSKKREIILYSVCANIVNGFGQILPKPYIAV